MHLTVGSKDLAIGDVIFPEFGPIVEMQTFLKLVAITRRIKRSKQPKINFSDTNALKYAILTASQEAECYEFVPGSIHVRFANGVIKQFGDDVQVEVIRIKSKRTRQQSRAA